MSDEDDDSPHLHLSITLDWSKYNIDKSDRSNAVSEEWMSFKLTYDAVAGRNN